MNSKNFILINLNHTINRARQTAIKEERSKWILFGLSSAIFLSLIIWTIIVNNSFNNLIKSRESTIENIISKTDNLKKAAMKTHDNRGASAGIIDYKKLHKLPSYANNPNQFKRVDKFRIIGYESKDTGKWVNNSFGNLSQSNIIG